MSKKDRTQPVVIAYLKFTDDVTGEHWVLSIGVTLGFRITSFLKIGVPFLALQAGVVIL